MELTRAAPAPRRHPLRQWLAPLALALAAAFVAFVGVPLWEHGVAVVLVLACISVLVRFAGRVYAHGLLHAGPQLSARAAWTLTRER